MHGGFGNLPVDSSIIGGGDSEYRIIQMIGPKSLLFPDQSGLPRGPLQQLMQFSAKGWRNDRDTSASASEERNFASGDVATPYAGERRTKTARSPALAGLAGQPRALSTSRAVISFIRASSRSV